MIVKLESPQSKIKGQK